MLNRKTAVGVPVCIVIIVSLLLLCHCQTGELGTTSPTPVLAPAINTHPSPAALATTKIRRTRPLSPMTTPGTTSSPSASATVAVGGTPSTVEEAIEAVLQDYSQSLSAGWITRDDLYSSAMKELVQERRVFYGEFFQVALHSTLTGISSTFEINSIVEDEQQAGIYRVKAAEMIEIQASYQKKGCLTQAVYWASLQASEPSVKASLLEYFDELTKDQENSLWGKGTFLTTFVPFHTLVLSRQGDTFQIIQDTYSDAANDNPSGTDVIKWRNGTFARRKPDLTRYPDFEIHRHCIEEQGTELLTKYSTSTALAPTTTAGVTPSPTDAAKATPSATAALVTLTDEPPIIVVSSDRQNGETVIHLTCLNGQDCDRDLDIEWYRDLDISSATMDGDGNIHILPMHNRPRGILYVIPKHDSIRKIGLETNALSLAQYCDGRMVFADSSAVSSIVIMERDLSYRVVRLGSIGPWTPLNRIGALVQGEKGKVIAIYEQPIERDGRQFAGAFIIDLESGEVTEALLPAPQFGEHTEAPALPGVKYNGMFIGVSSDLKKLYYSYLEKEVGENAFHTRLGMFDTEEQKEFPYVYDDCCPSSGGYLQHKEYLMVGYPQAISTLLLHMKDLSPVEDLYELLKGEETARLSIHPFGQYFIVGLVDKVFLFSQDGNLLNEYPLPPEVIGQDYRIVEYTGDSWSR